MKNINFLYLFLLMILTSCASGFDRNSMKKQLTASEQSFKETRVLDGKIKSPLQVPFKLSVYLGNNNDPYFKELAKKELSPLKEELISDHLITDFSTESHDSEAILTLSYACQTDHYLNSYALLYPTLFGFFAFPGDSVATLCLVDANLINAQNGFLYFNAEGSGWAEVRKPKVYMDVQELNNKALEKAFEALTPELLKAFRKLPASL